MCINTVSVCRENHAWTSQDSSLSFTISRDYYQSLDLSLSLEDHGLGLVFEPMNLCLGLERFILESKPEMNHVTLCYVCTALMFALTEMELFGP